MKRVLHIEDDPDLQAYVAAIIGNKVDLMVAASLKEAYKVLDTDRFNLILLDLTLPDGSGMDVLNELDKHLEHIPPVIIFSAHEVTNTLSNVNKVLVKGRFNDDNLLSSVTELLNL